MKDQSPRITADYRHVLPVMTHAMRCAAMLIAMTLILPAAMVVAQSTPSPLMQVDGSQVTMVEAGPDASALRIDAGVRRVDTGTFAIQGGKRYELSFQARLDSTFVVELNDRAHQFVLQSHRYRLTSTYQLIFLDGDGNEVTAFGTGGRGFMLTQSWQRYVMAFHTPEAATAVKIRFEPAGHTTLLRDVQLNEIRNLETVNLNPDFRHGELNYSGWNAVREGRLYTRPDGQVVLKPGYGGTSGIFPLSPDQTYRVTAKGAGGRINMVYYDENGKQLHSRFLIRPSAEGNDPVEFIPPEGTRYGKLLTYQIDYLQACHVVKVSKPAGP